LFLVPCPQRCRLLAPNVGAAWQSGGGTLRLPQGTVAENYATAFQQGFTPAVAKPHVISSGS